MTSFCSEREVCVAFMEDSPECQTDNGCFTKENIEAYLEWCRVGIEAEIRRWKKEEELKK